jgi:hypothetical protein
MTTPIACTYCSSITNYIGFGPDSKKVEKIFHDMDRGNTTQTLGSRRELLNNLDEVFEKYSKPNWDGYGANPITEAAYLEARELIRTIPIDPIFPSPEIIPEPNGEIAFEWYRENRQVFILSVSGKNEIIYSGLFGLNKTHGVEYFTEFLPQGILNSLKRLYS